MQSEPVETTDLYGAYPRLDDAQIVALAEAVPGVRRRPGRYCSGPGDVTSDFLVVLDERVAVVQDLGPAERPIAVHGQPGSSASSGC